MTTTPSPGPDAALGVARSLLQAGCVTFRADEPFRLPSGWASPVYIDCRRLISFPALRSDLVRLGLARLEDAGALRGLASIAGGEASGIALAALMADRLALPLQYVRKKAVGLGATPQIEGVVQPRGRVLLVDDMMAAGHSKRNFCKALQAAGAEVNDIFVVFDYGCFPTAPLLAPLGVAVHALATWRDVLAVAGETGSGGASPRALAELEKFLADPSAWSASHGGMYEPLQVPAARGQ